MKKSYAKRWQKTRLSSEFYVYAWRKKGFRVEIAKYGKKNYIFFKIFKQFSCLEFFFFFKDMPYVYAKHTRNFLRLV